MLNGYNNFIDISIEMNQTEKMFSNEDLYHLSRQKGCKGSTKVLWDEELKKMKKVYVENPNYSEFNDKMKYWFEVEMYGTINWDERWDPDYKMDGPQRYDRADHEFYIKKIYCPAPRFLKYRFDEFVKFIGEKEIKLYLGIKDFIDYYSLNISPKWGSGIKVNDKVKYLKDLIKDILNNYDLFSDVAYAIECGHKGEHIHAHCVYEVNEDKLAKFRKSVKNGFNLTNQWCKLWDKRVPKGLQGAIKGRHALQYYKVKTEEVLNDKLDYLIEEKKPESHKNKPMPGFPIYKGFSD